MGCVVKLGFQTRKGIIYDSCMSIIAMYFQKKLPYPSEARGSNDIHHSCTWDDIFQRCWCDNHSISMTCERGWKSKYREHEK